MRVISGWPRSPSAGQPADMNRNAAIAIHFLALVAILLAVGIIAFRDAQSGEVLAAALLGFVLGILFDRWLLRPVVDWRMSHARR